jgi:PKD repeat protein
MSQAAGEWRLPHWHGSGSCGAQVAYSHAQPTPPIHLWDYFVTLGWEDSMRSIRLMAATTVILTGVWACGDGGGVEPNLDPVASFTAPASCTVGTPCAFTDGSNDPDGTITARTWDFGDGTPPLTGTETAPSHTYTAAANVTVTLTVTDNGGKTNLTTRPVTVGGGTANVPPTAAFTFLCTGLNCTFTDGSADTDGNIAGWSWNFGDGSPAVTTQHSTHSYAAAGTFNVELTVTDDDGATAKALQAVTVTAPAATNCTTSGADVTCELSITQRSNVTITLTGSECELSGNNVVVLQPYSQNAFFNTCSLLPPVTYTLKDATGAALAVNPGALRIRLHQGTAGAGSPTPGAPAARLEGTYPNWTISIDDGGNPTGPGEPDFTDVVLSVQATAAP